MTTSAHVPDAGSYVEMTASDEQAARVRVISADGPALRLSAPLAAVPAVGSAVLLRWSAAPRGRYALPCTVASVDENNFEVRVSGAVEVEQQRHFVRGGGGEQIVMRRDGAGDAHGFIRDISEHSTRAFFEGIAVDAGEEMDLYITLGDETVEVPAVVARVATMAQQVPPGPVSVELVAIFSADENQARLIRRYVMQMQLLSRSRA